MFKDQGAFCNMVVICLEIKTSNNIGVKLRHVPRTPYLQWRSWKVPGILRPGVPPFFGLRWRLFNIGPKDRHPPTFQKSCIRPGICSTHVYKNNVYLKVTRRQLHAIRRHVHHVLGVHVPQGAQTSAPCNKKTCTPCPGRTRTSRCTHVSSMQ